MEIWDIYDEHRIKTGRTIVRGEDLKRNEFHLAVHIWIKNSRNEWLISKRTPNKNFPLLWECTGGSAISGEESITAALREVNEELGVILDKTKGYLYKTLKRDVYHDFCDVWIFEHDCDINDIVLQEGETCDAMWASNEKIHHLINNKKFIPLDNMQYVYELIGNK